MNALMDDFVGVFARTIAAVYKFGRIIVAPFALLIIMVPIVAVLYSLGWVGFGKFLWTATMYVGTVMLFGCFVTMVVLLKILKTGTDTGFGLPQGVLRMMGVDSENAHLVTKEYVTGFKQLLMGVAAWFIFFIFFTWLLPMERMPIGLVVMLVAFIAAACMQEGWKDHPPVLSRNLAIFMVITMFTAIPTRVLFPDFSAKTWKAAERTVHIIGVGLDRGMLYLLEVTGIDDVPPTEEEKQKAEAEKRNRPPVVANAAGQSAPTASSVSLTPSGQSVYQLAVARENNRRNGYVSHVADGTLRINARCPRIVATDCQEPWVKSACPTQCP